MQIDCGRIKAALVGLGKHKRVSVRIPDHELGLPVRLMAQRFDDRHVIEL